jgi:cation/acetate symporter
LNVSSPGSTAIFAAVVASTLAITYWAGRRTVGAQDYYAAGARITAGQNALALAGDYLSAASFLGVVAAFFTLGVDGLLYAVGAVSGWPIAMFLIAEPLRRLGRYTFADALSFRLAQRPVRIVAACSTLCLCGSYLVAQMVAAGALIQVLFDVAYAPAVVVTGALMVIYVCFGGMLATTWIQIVKASLLLTTALVMVVLVIARFEGVDALIVTAAHSHGTEDLLRPGRLLPDWISAVSLGLAFAFGPAGLPHVLMRFFTVKDGTTARRSLSRATMLIGVFQICMVVLGYGAAALLPNAPLAGGPNTAAIHLSYALGGTALMGVTAAIAFATILAVVSGLALAGAAAVSHDLYRHVLRRDDTDERSEIFVSRIATLILGAVVVLAALRFQHENVAFLATLPLVIAASVNFPLLALAMYWRGLTTRGAVAGGTVGLVLSVSLLLFSYKVWVVALGHARSLFPYEYPTIFSLGAALVVAMLVSVTDNSVRAAQERNAFDAQFATSHDL